MNCHKTKLKMGDRLSGNLSQAELKPMDDHLESCAACKAVWTEECRLWGITGNYPEPPKVSADFTAQVLSKARAEVRAEEDEHRIIEFPVRKRRWAPAAAAAVLALVAGGYLFSMSGHEKVRFTDLDKAEVSDDMIIANLDILEDLELLENLEFFEDLDIIEALAVN